MTALRVTPPTEEEEGAEVDGMEGAGESVISVHGRFGQSWSLFRRINTTLMAFMAVK